MIAFPRPSGSRSCVTYPRRDGDSKLISGRGNSTCCLKKSSDTLKRVMARYIPGATSVEIPLRDTDEVKFALINARMYYTNLFRVIFRIIPYKAHLYPYR